MTPACTERHAGARTSLPFLLSPGKRAACVLLGVILAVLPACAPEHEWQTSSITGKLPDLEFELTDERGRPVTEENYSGKVNLLFFGYTSCPDVCPTTLARLQATMDQLGPTHRLAVRVLFVSVDPRRDPPERLARYTRAFGERIVGLTADEPTLEKLTARYGASFSYDKPDDHGNYAVQHPGSVYVFDSDGDARLLFRASDSIDAMASDLRTLLP